MYSIIMTSEIKIALLPTLVVSILAAFLFGTPDLIIAILLLVAIFLTTNLVLLWLLSWTQYSIWTPCKKGMTIWLVAAAVAVGTTILVSSLFFNGALIHVFHRT